VRKWLAPVLLVATVWLGAGPVLAQAPSPGDEVDPAIADGSAQRELDAARERWRAAGLSSYRFRVRNVCFCGPRFTRPAWVFVRDGRPVDPPKRVRDVATVPRLLRKVQTAIDERVDGLSVRYGARGVPRSIAIDYVKQLADEEDTFIVDHVWAR
jgi:hypothetical protein